MSYPSVYSRGRQPKLLPALVAFAAAVTTVVTFAQPGDRSAFLGGAAPLSHPNFDIRTYKEDPFWQDKADAAEYLVKHGVPAARQQDLAVDRVSGLARLELAHPGVAVDRNPALGTTELVTAPGPTFLTGPAGDRAATLRAFLATHAAAYGLSQAQVGELELVADYMNPAGNMGFAEFEQRFSGIPVFQGLLRGGFTAKGELVRTTGVLATGIDTSALASTPSIGAAHAVSLAAGSVGWDVPEGSLSEQPSAIAGQARFSRANMADEPTAWLVYFPLAPGAARLAWATQIWSTSDVFLTVLDAETGTMLFRKNLTEYQTQAVTYNVYTSDSPAPASPSAATPDNHLQAPFVARQNVTLIGNEAPYTFNYLGWITDFANSTDGNNVEAGIDRDGTNGVDATVPGSSNRVFNYAYNPELDSPLTPAFQNGDVANMFYWVNRYHDFTYLLGFTETARNFQSDNFGRGGLGADRISAEGQDSSSTNNANFSTPVDGSRGRMQMFLWTGPTPDRSGDLDQDVIFHELTHGLSNRLHANAAGLTSNMARGMGEGWSDFYARSLLSTADESVNGIYTIGGYVTREAAAGFLDNYYYGIRRFPYAPRAVTGGAMNRPHSPLTFADIDSTQADLTDGAYPRGPFGVATVDQVHNVGEVWGGMLWEVRARFITRLGHAVGNQRILQFVTDAMKLDPLNPTLVQARDAILAAAQAGGGSASDVADIWQGFATRGLGVMAQVINPGSGADDTRVIESYIAPTDPVPSFSISDVTANEGNGGATNFTFTVTLTNPAAGTEHRVSFATASGTATLASSTLTAATPTVIPAGAPGATSGPAGPYPIPLNVAGLPGTISSLAVRVNGLTHTFPGDLDVLLVGPGGQRSLLMSDVGGGTDVAGVDLTFQDGAPPPPVPLTSGTFHPIDVVAGDVMPAPAPAGPYTSSLSVFNGTDPNGTWNLYVTDDAGGDVGSLNGFSLIITTSGGPGDYVPASGQLVFPAGTVTQTIGVTVNGDAVVEGTEQFFVNLFGSINAVVSDAQGLGTIVNDDANTIQPPTNFRIESIVGNIVTFGWTPPALGPAPTGYVVEGGVGSGSMDASLPTGTVPRLAVSVPNGAFFARVHALDGATRSAASNEIPIYVNVPVPPSAPANLLGLVNGDSLALAWKNTFGGGVPTGIVLDVTGTVATTIPLGTADSFQFTGVPPGTYTLSLRALNGAGASPSSNAVTLTFPGPCSGAPQAATNFVAYRIGSMVYVSWDPAASGPAPTSYILRVTGDVLNGDLPLGGRAISSPVGPGTYNLSVITVNPCGSGPATAVQSVVVP